MLYDVGEQVIVGGLPYRVLAVNRGRGRMTLSPVQVVGDYEKGEFVDHQFIDEDPVWVAYEDEDGKWAHTEKPQSVHHFAYGEMLAVAGEEPGLYGYQFVDRQNLFLSREEASNECQRRNSETF